MGRKKRKINIELKPFCYYCDREFDDEKVLIQHQKAKHFKCLQCNRKLDVASGLVIHMMQVHKSNLKTVPNALPKRNDPEIIIRGMDGVPPEIIEENLSKLKQKLGDKNIKRQQRVNWAQVAMAPTMEQFLQQAQMGNFSFPGFNSPLLPTNNLLPNGPPDSKKKNIPPMPLFLPNNFNMMQPPPLGANMYPPVNQHNASMPNMPPPHMPSSMTPPNAPSSGPAGFPPNIPTLPPGSAQKYPPNVNFPGSAFPQNLSPNMFQPPPHSMYMPPGLGQPPVPPSAPPMMPPAIPPSAPPGMAPHQPLNPDDVDAKLEAGAPDGENSSPTKSDTKNEHKDVSSNHGEIANQGQPHSADENENPGGSDSGK
ncbi:zinc finger protein, putative [Plasmodium vivax]|uniref:Zinc finger protein, putative n=2 Tax=Plasmodium vivax TaxID=5855 RepID=A0A1G4GW51_PLAVI|nr:hypothetical protein PVBG_02797 [Plasmodium vivax Brazil I]SCO66810.1 zinc finger protein, putative [Plasmodium vivax]VUZ95223.1 zinc finger protein, putative [Plasmodium vivax]